MEGEADCVGEGGGRGDIFPNFPPNVKTLKKYPKNPKMEKNPYVSSNLVLKFSFFQGRKEMVEKCWETAVTKRLAKANYRGVGFGFDSSDCTKTLGSYHHPPPPNLPLNSLTFPNNNPIFVPIHSTLLHFPSQPSPSPTNKIHKKLTKSS